MSITFKKRQKELKRQEKQRAKAERREQRKLAKRAAAEESPDAVPANDSDTAAEPQCDSPLDSK
jgi:hypothetical protein